MGRERCIAWYSWANSILLCSVACIKMLSRCSWSQFWIKITRGKSKSEKGFIIGASVTKAREMAGFQQTPTKVTSGFWSMEKTSANRFGNCGQKHTFSDSEKQNSNHITGLSDYDFQCKMQSDMITKDLVTWRRTIGLRVPFGTELCSGRPQDMVQPQRPQKKCCLVLLRRLWPLLAGMCTSLSWCDKYSWSLQMTSCAATSLFLFHFVYISESKENITCFICYSYKCFTEWASRDLTKTWKVLHCYLIRGSFQFDGLDVDV